LLEAGAIDGARGILINITGSSSLKLAEVQEACTIIQTAAHEDANIIFGAVLDDKMKDSVKITVIATGFKDSDIRRRRQDAQSAFMSSHQSGFEDSEIVPEPMPVAPPPPPAGGANGESMSLEGIHGAVLQKDNLDVPAFLRKRGDVM
jgi:cell division protein FtsZ